MENSVITRKNDCVDLLMAMFCGTFTPPAEVSVRRHLCMKGGEERENETAARAEVEVLRFLREYNYKWFSPGEIHFNIKTRLSVGGLGIVLRDLAKEDFIHAEATKKKRVTLYKFKGAK